MALDNLEQMHPRYLADLLENGQLQKVLNNRVNRYHQTLLRIKQRVPEMPDDTLREIAQSEHLIDVNPDWQEEQPLTKAEKRALKEFLRNTRKPPTPPATTSSSPTTNSPPPQSPPA